MKYNYIIQKTYVVDFSEIKVVIKVDVVYFKLSF